MDARRLEAGIDRKESDTQRFFIAAALAAALVTPVAAAQAGNIPTTGARIGLLAPPGTFPANTAFHVTQGFTCEAAAGAGAGRRLGRMPGEDRLERGRVDVSA